MRAAPFLKPLVGALLSGALLTAVPALAREPLAETATLSQASLDAAAQLRERALGDGTA